MDALFPFTLSIRDADSLYDFIRGEITLAVAVDPSELVRQFSVDGIDVILRDDDNTYAVWMRRKGQPGTSAVSRQMFGRLFYEFQSLSWFVAAHAGMRLRLMKLWLNRLGPRCRHPTKEVGPQRFRNSGRAFPTNSILLARRGKAGTETPQDK